MKHLGVLLPLAAMLAAAPAGAQTAPLRTMVYQFTYDSHAFGGSPEVSGQGTVSENSSADMAGRTGQMTIAVVQATADGGMVVDVTEHIDRSAEPDQKVRCAVYGRTGDVVCDQNFHASNEERMLLTYVGRFFYDPAQLDAKGHWHTEPALRSAVTVSNDFTVRKTDGPLVTIGVDRKENGLGYVADTTGTIVYDSAMELPKSIALSTSAVNSGNQGDASGSFTLVSDSMAAGASQTPH